MRAMKHENKTSMDVLFHENKASMDALFRGKTDNSMLLKTLHSDFRLF